jgi:PAS domain S-box-containing protein
MRAEQEDRGAEYQLLFDMSTVGMAESEPHTLAFTRVNAKVSEITGYSREELLQMTSADLTHPDDRAANQASIERAYQEKQASWIIEKRYVRKDGQVIWVRVNGTFLTRDGHPTRALAVIEDITQRKAAEEALRDNEERYRNLFLNAQESFTVYDVERDAEGGIVDWVLRDANPESLGNMGRALEEVAGRRATELFAPEHAAQHIELSRKVMASGEPHRLEMSLPAGKYFLISVFPIGLDRLVLSGTDITAIKKAEKELKELNETLEQRVVRRTSEVQHLAHQLRELNLKLSDAEERERRRLSEVLHDDLQQLLVAAKCHLEVAARHTFEEAVCEALVNVETLIERSIDCSRTLSHELSPPALYRNGLVDALHWLGRQVKQKYDLSVTVEAVPEDEPRTEYMTIFLYRAAQELLFNVVKHAGTREAWLTLWHEDGDVLLQVEDEGKGVPLDIMDAITEENGLGLASLRERLEILGGRLDVSAGVGRGSSFMLRVPDDGDYQRPTHRAGPGRRESENAHAEKPDARRLRVLLADDHRVMRQGLASLIEEEEDMSVVGQAGNGREAVDMVAALTPDVVVMDINMPIMDGIEATRQIRERFPEVRIVALSMYDKADMARRMLQAGAEAYLPKAGPPDALVKALRGGADRG